MRDVLPVPAEVDVLGTYFPPLLLAFIFGVLAMVATVRVMNRYRLSRFFMYPNLVMLAILIIYTLFFGVFVFPS